MMTTPADAAELPLPTYKHVPGVNARPHDAVLAAIAAHAHRAGHGHSEDGNIAWHYGLRLMREGFYFEAHEVLEPLWFNARPNSRERHLVRGLIQIANAGLKARMGRVGAAQRLLGLARTCLLEASEGDASVLGLVPRRIFLLLGGGSDASGLVRTACNELYAL